MSLQVSVRCSSELCQSSHRPTSANAVRSRGCLTPPLVRHGPGVSQPGQLQRVVLAPTMASMVAIPVLPVMSLMTCCSYGTAPTSG